MSLSVESKVCMSDAPRILHKEVVYDLLNEKISEVIQSIVADNRQRLDFTGNISLLARGIFYPQDYYKALKITNQIARLEYFLKRDSFYNGYLNPKYFDLVKDEDSPSGKLVANFILKKGIDPVEALQSIRKDLSLIGCGEVCQLAQYEAVLEIIGPEKFKCLFSADSSTPLILGSSLNNNPIARLRTYILEEEPKPEQIRKGDQVYFKNIEGYCDKHLNGMCSGYNVICIDDSSETPKFTTLGLPPQGLTKVEMNETMVRDYNSPFTGFEYLSERTKLAYFKSIGSHAVALSEENAQSQISIEDFETLQGGKTTLLCELDVEKITQLAISTLKNARYLLDSFKAKRGKRLS
ncbi:MAG: hypothetical protein H0X29_01965 [Parachlamydiaceae bacterium]|nr:hypothetical protein [Parachlamydiaceae bacterium]